ncbi:sodium channel and clathrin linker 1-like [Centruroides sculpturatus]|uniref:sodium channel and clathrin linker 1-like n=1 Tax=Centruroides sculpturatus TaxID=218467 RepID=UPI000C6DBFB0|nr:sodium channel and clathrin linker 1-like [Centruroides sculpturatus]
MSSGETEKDSENLSQTNAEQKCDANGNGNGNGNEISAAENKNYSYISNDLLEEYHKTVESMRSEITTYEKEQETLSNEVLRLVEENKKLSKELSEANTNKSTADENNVHNLQEQLRTITEARDSAVQMWQNAVQEITRLQHIVQDNNEKQTQYDRVVREKRAAEEELELLRKEGLQSKPQNSLLFDDLTKRLATAEQSRNQAQLKIQSLESKIKKMETCHQHEMSLCSKEKLSLHERVQELQEEFSQICLEKVKLTDEIEQMKQQIKDTEKNGLLLEKNAEKEIKTLKKKLQQQQEEWQYQLRSLEERFQTSAFELQKLLDAQKKMSEKWKAEAKGLADKLEKETKEMYLETLNLQQTNEKLYLELENSQIRIAQSEQQLAEYKAKILNLQQQMKNLQSL